MKSVQAYRYRWFILLSLVLLVFSVEIQWMNLSPMGRVANSFYSAHWLNRSLSVTDLFSFIFMGGFVLFSIPCSYLIYRIGIRWAAISSTVLIVLASLIKLLYVQDFVMMVIAQVVFSIAHAIVQNLITVTVARWFPIRERGMAVGLVSACQYISLSFVMLFSPYLMHDGSFVRLNAIYSIISFVCALPCTLIFQENPPSPSSFVEPATLSYLKNFKLVDTIKSLRGIIIIFAINWGIVMSLLVKIDFISSQMGIKAPSGFLGLTMLLSGAVGAVVIPSLSDRFKKRKFFYTLCMGMAVPGILIMTFAKSAFMGYVGSAVLGYFAFSAIPVGLQYGAELGTGIAEEVVQGRIMFFSQAVGAVILLFTMSHDELVFNHFLGFFIALFFACFVGSTFLSESKVIITEEERLDKVINQEIVHVE